MRLHYYIKNIFLAVFVLFFLATPELVNADYDFGTTHAGALKKAGWTDQQIKKLDENVNNLKSGSTYSYTTSASGMAGVAPSSKSINVNLYKADPKKQTLSGNELSGLKDKLREGGSNASQYSLSLDNVYQINTGSTTNYVYDPTPSDKTNNDEKVLGTATSDGWFLSYKEPILKEKANATAQENISSKDVSTLDGVLNATDIANGRLSGTSVAYKNAEFNQQQIKDGYQLIYDEKLKELREAQDKYAKDPSDVNRATLEALQKEADNAGRDVYKAGGNLNRTQLEKDAASQAAKAQADTKNTPEECRSTLSHPLAPIDNMYCILTFVGKGTNIILNLSSYFAYITGTLFDYSLEFSINSAEFFKKLGVIEITWSFIRDILNITFIFILLWTAVQILIGNEGKYNAKKVLMNVVIFAVLMNFSLFAAKFMVDTSNVVSLKIYESMKADSVGNKASISSRIMNTVGLSTLYNVTEIFNSDKLRAQGTCAADPGKLIIVSVMGSVLLIVLSLALGLAAILFLIRLVNIIFLFIKSPLWVWGNVLPGNPYMSKLTKDWWSSMKHVLVFPILYLFWMLIAIIVFEKLGQVKTVAADGTTQNGISLLDLICNGPGAGNIGQSISLIAIFAIVIIFMMQAIKYGFKHAGDGGEESLGKGMASAAAKRFSGFQTAMTTGLAKKAGGISVGAANRGIKIAGNTTVRGGGGIIGGTRSLMKGEGFKKGAKDGFLNPGINAKEAFRDMAKKTVLSTEGGVFDKLGITSAAAKIAEKYKDPTNKAGETKKKATERRAANAFADQKRRAEITEEKYKVESYEKWKKKNSSGTLDDYKNYAEEKIKSRLDRLYGENISSIRSANGKTFLENINDSAIIKYQEEKRDSDGNIELDSAGKPIMVDKIRFDESAMRSNVQKMAKDDTVKERLSVGKQKGILLRNIRAQGRMKALEAHESSQKTKSDKRTRNENKTREFEKDIPDLKSELKSMPKMDIVETAVSTRTVVPIPAGGYKGKKLRDVNLAIDKFNTEYAKPAGTRNQTKVDELREKMESKYEEYVKHYKNVEKAVRRKEEEYSDHLAKLAEEEN